VIGDIMNFEEDQAIEAMENAITKCETDYEHELFSPDQFYR